MTLRRRDVFTAGFVAWAAWGLFVHWIPVLKYLNYAFIIGFFTAIASVALLSLTTSRSKSERFPSDSLRNSSIKFLSSSKWPLESSNYSFRGLHKHNQLYPASFVISQALDNLMNLVLDQFLRSWYGNITKSPVFVDEVEKTIRGALEDIRDRIFDEDIVNVAVSRMVPIITSHLREFDTAERAVRGRSLSRNVTESEELDMAIAAKYKEGKLHPSASLAFSDTKVIQQEFLRKMLVRILPDVLPESMVKSRAVSVLVKEIVSCAVLLPVMQLMADPDTWNQLIEAYGKMTLQDRKTVRRMRAALDEHASPSPKTISTLEFPKLAPHDNERAFERFVRAIRRTNNLSDARRFRSQVASQLRRESMVEGQDQTYLRRLETGKRVLDQKVAKLANVGSAASTAVAHQDFRNGGAPKVRDLSLVEIMHTSSGLSYFMEYMDRQKLMPMVQFWIVVDGLRNPLEDDFGDETSPTDRASHSESDRLDIAQVNEAYMSKPELKVPEEAQQAIKSFLAAGRKATHSQYRAARTAILSTQSAVLDELQEHHLPSFRKSDLYYKFLASDESSPGRPSGHSRMASNASATKLPSREGLPMVRTNSQPSHLKDLRRAALSSSDMRSMSSSNLFENVNSGRRSVDIDGSGPLFDDGYDTDPLAHSTISLGQDSLNGDVRNREEVIENMEAALNDIMTEDPHDDSWNDHNDALFDSPISSHRSIKSTESPRGSLDFPPIEPVTGEKLRPNLANLGLVNTSSRIGVFSDNDLFPDEEKFIEDEYADHDQSDAKDSEEEEIHAAAPGDLGLTEAITVLNNDIEKLISQESVVDTLTRKAELTNNVAELRILGKSKASIQREIRRKELQRQQYIVQESDNSLYGRSSVRIKSIMVGKDDDGKEFALYVIEVQRQAGDQMPAATWSITRRYSEFHDLHQRLRRRYPSTKNLEFPRRRMVMKLQKQFLHNRKLALEGYLQQILRLPDVCRSRELRSFLSQQAILQSYDPNSSSDTQDIVSRIYNSVTDGMDDFLGNIAVLDQLSTAGQNLISAATNQLGSAQNDIISVEPGSIAEAEAELLAFEDKELEPFVKPICDIFLETFELNRGNNWLRGRAVVVVLHQLLGGTIERKIRDLVKGYTQEDSILRYIDLVKETMWPGGRMREAKPRTAAEKQRSKREARVMLATLIPDLAASVVGRANAQAAARRIFATMNNERLNQHLAYSILDEIVAVLFNTSAKAVC